MSALVPVVEKLDQVPEAARTFYEQKDGKYVLKLDGAPAGFVPAADLASANGKVVEFRDKNIALLQEVDTLRPLKTQFEGIDPVAAKDAIAKVAELGKKGLKGVDDVTAAMNAAVQAAVKPLQEQLQAQAQSLATEKTRADESTLRSKVSDVFLKAGGKANALDFIVGQAKSVFQVDGGEVKAAPNKFSADRPGEPLGIQEWITGQVKVNDFAFGPSTGTGAVSTQTGNKTVNDTRKVLVDPTPQQLGQYGKEISKGEMRVEYTNK